MLLLENKFPYKTIDLTHTITEEIPTWDLKCGFSKEIAVDYHDCQEKVKFQVHHINMQAGIGTHIDSPAHCISNSKTVEKFSLDELISPCICINISNKIDPSYKLSVLDIKEFEENHGKIPSGSFVVVCTGWGKYWFEPAKYHNGYNFPSISAEAAVMLLNRDVVGIGIDTLSPDIPSSEFIVHQLFLENGKYIVENIANAEKLPSHDSYVLVMPIKAEKLTEAPIRLIGLI